MRYRVYAHDLSVRTSFVDADIAVLNGAATFVTAIGGEALPHEVALAPAAGWSASVTTDGALAYGLTHPSHGVEKEYEAVVNRPLSAETIARLQTGIEIEDGRTAPCRVQQEPCEAGARVRLVLHEGRKRQVRRMLAAVGSPVRSLHRVRVGPLGLGDLPPGAFRVATDDEVAALRAAAGIDPDRTTADPPASG